MTNEQAFTYKLIYWAHNRDLEFHCKSDGVGYFFAKITGVMQKSVTMLGLPVYSYELQAVLRTIDDLTEAERLKWESLRYGDGLKTLESPESQEYLLSLGVDVYGLIEAGHAVRKGGEE